MSRSQQQRLIAGFYPVIMMAVIGLLSSIATAYAYEFIPTDDQITAAIRANYLFDRAVENDAITITTKNGIVSLTGTVTNILAQERAVNIAENVHGVRAVINRLNIFSQSPQGGWTDEEIKAAIEEHRKDDPAADHFGIEVEVKDGVVTLVGTANSWVERQVCKNVVKSVPGVKAIKNEVKLVISPYRPDNEIKKDIDSLFLHDVKIDASKISTGVSDGNVSLEGSVGSFEEKQRIASMVFISGVKSVDDSKLQVEKPDPERMIRTYRRASCVEGVRSSVKEALFNDPRIPAYLIDVEVDCDMVTLKGTVNDYQVRNIAEQDARNVYGVAVVRNLIEVRRGDISFDYELRKRIEAAFEIDYDVEKPPIIVRTDAGNVTLTGTVNSSYQKQRAEQICREIEGVKQVNNLLGYKYKWEPRPDQDIRSAISKQMFWSPFISPDDVRINVHNGRVTLLGVVKSKRQFDAAEKNAWQGGAKIVMNKLTIKD
jgi:osmotically-inducible protein OsmY